MKVEVIARLQKTFEQIIHKENNTEYWLARELQELLGYSKRYKKSRKTIKIRQ